MEAGGTSRSKSCKDSDLITSRQPPFTLKVCAVLSVLRNWFSSTSKTTSAPACSLASMHSEATDPQRMLYPLPSTQLSQLHQKAVCWLQLSIWYNLTHDADWKTKHTGLEWHTLQLDIKPPHEQTLRQIGSHTSSTLVLNMVVPRGCRLHHSLAEVLYLMNLTLQGEEGQVLSSVTDLNANTDRQTHTQTHTLHSRCCSLSYVSVSTVE